MAPNNTIKTCDYVAETARTANSARSPYFLAGLTGELGELCSCSPSNVENELGDVLWYYTRFLCSIDQEYPLSVGDVFLKEFNDEDGIYYELIQKKQLVPYMLLQVCMVNELYKKLVGHNKPVVKELVEETRKLLPMLARYGVDNGTSLSKAAKSNVEKLRKRYPDGFSFEASAKRADEAQ